MILFFIFLVACLCAPTAARAEDWPGYTGGNLHQNSSATELAPAGVGKLWQRSFIANPGLVPTPLSRTAGARGALNLVKVGNYLALIGNDANERSGNGAVVLLDTTRNGNTANNFNVQCLKNDGEYSNFFYPTGIEQVSSDMGHLLQLLYWDAKTGILYVNSGGDGLYASAYKPLANLQTYRNGKLQPGVPAFAGLQRKWVGGSDRPQDFPAPKDPANPDAPDPDLWFTLDNHSTAYFEIDPDLPLIASTKKWHEQRGWLYFVNKLSGIFIPGKPHNPADAGKPTEWRYDTDESEPRAINEPAYQKSIRHLNPFGAMGATRLANGRIFMMGPSDDNNNDGELGDASLCGASAIIEAEAAAKLSPPSNGGGMHDRADDPDQGLYLWACKVSVDKSGIGNGALPGEAGVDTVKLDKAFVYRFPSDHKPVLGIEDADSYLETDFYYRKKAWLVDGSGVWAAWKPGKNRGVELIHADDSGAQKYDLQVGIGLQGKDIWPHLAMSTVAQHKYLVYFFGNALRREVVVGKPYLAMGTFARETMPPAWPAELAVFDAKLGSLRYTFNMSAAFPSLQPNDEWRYYDRSQMVVAGKQAWVAWVDMTKPEASLHLACFDITADRAQPVETMIPLGFPSANNKRSNVTDLIASDGKLYALVTQSDLLGPNDPTWDAQHVVCVGPVAPGAVLAASDVPPRADAFKPVYPPKRKHAELPPFLEKQLKADCQAYVRSLNENTSDYRIQAIGDAMYLQYMCELPVAFDFTPEELERLKSGKTIIDEEEVVKGFDELRKKANDKLFFLTFEKNLFDKWKLNASQTALFYKIAIGKAKTAKGSPFAKPNKSAPAKASEPNPASLEQL